MVMLAAATESRAEAAHWRHFMAQNKDNTMQCNGGVAVGNGVSVPLAS